MDGFDQLDWESTIDLVKRFGGLLVAALIALLARGRKQSQEEYDEGEEDPQALDQEPVASQYRPIGPGTDAAKMSEEYSQQARRGELDFG